MSAMIPANSVQLIGGGNVIKQGDETPLTFQLNDESGQPVDLAGATVTVRMANSQIVVLTKQVTVNDDNTVSFAITSDEATGHGEMRLEFVVNKDGKQEIFPAQGFQQITIQPSLGSLDSGYVAVITLEEFERRVNEAVNRADTATDGAIEAMNAANTAAQNVSTATESANQAAELANSAADKANQATQNATAEASNLSQLKTDVSAATDEANSAATSANTAAQNATTQANYAKQQGDYAKTQGDYAKAEADRLVNTDVSQLDLKIGDLSSLHTQSKQSVVEAINETTAQLAENVQPYTYIDMGVAFDSNDSTLSVYDSHASWTHGCVSYDEEDDKIIVFYNVKPSHVLTNNRVLMRKKDVEGNFSDIFVVANRINENISCKTQSSGIAKNGDYISIVAHFDNTTGEVLGTWIYRSSDKGNTWTYSELKINGQSIKAYNGDVTGFLVLKSGRILTWACRESDRLVTVMYSDDHANTWNFASIPTCYFHTEPAWCELSDGTIICYLRETVDGNYDQKTPARFTKSTDGGLTWDLPFVSQSILDFTNSNGHLIFHEDTKTVEFIHHSRFTQPDGYSSIYVSVANENNAKIDKMGEQIRISRLAPHGKNINGSLGDCGYIGACKTKSGVITAFYYNGTYQNAQICYLLGYKTVINRPRIEINQFTGEKNLPIGVFGIVPTYKEYFEQGTILLNVGSTDTLLADTTRIRLKDFVRVKPNTEYLLTVNDENFNVGVREYDTNFVNISDSGWKSEDYLFKTSLTTEFLKVVVKKTDDSNITPDDLKTNTFEINKYFRLNQKYLYNNGNEHEFDTGNFSEVLATDGATGVKNSNNIQLSFPSTTAAPAIIFMSQNAVDVAGFNRAKCKMIIDSVTGTADASIRFYTKVNPTSGYDGRVGFAKVDTAGAHELELAIPDGYANLYVAFAVSKPDDGITSSISARFFELFLE